MIVANVYQRTMMYHKPPSKFVGCCWYRYNKYSLEYERIFQRTIIDKNTILESDITHYFDILIIKNGIELTTNEWNIYTNKGGKLILNCIDLILEPNSFINFNNKGYKGGKIGGYQGYSYKNNHIDV